MAELEGEYVSGVPTYGPAGLRRWLILVVSWMTTLAILAVILRLLSRRIRKQPFWWDDYLIMFSMVWNWAVVAVGFAMFIEGVGYHADSLKPEAIANISMWLLVTEVIYIWNLCWTKLSLLLMYYRIFHTPFFKKLALAVGAFVVMWAICITFLFTFICVPTQKLWHPEIPGHCVSELGVWLANASSTIFSDIIILLLPIPQVWKLNLKRAEKVGLTVVFSLGFFAVFASSYRTWVLFNYSKKDISYTLAPLLVWSDIEMCAGIISACLPTLRPIVIAAATKMGISRFVSLSRGTQSSSQQLSSDRTSDGRSNGKAQTSSTQSLRGRADSTRGLNGNAFYRLPDDSELDGIEPTESGSIGQSKSGTKETWFEARSLEIDGYGEEAIRDEIPMQPLNKKDTFK